MPILPFVLFSLLADSIEAARIAIAVALNGILCHGSRALNSKSDIAAGCTCFDIACNVASVLYINAVSPWSGTLPLTVVALAAWLTTSRSLGMSPLHGIPAAVVHVVFLHWVLLWCLVEYDRRR